MKRQCLVLFILLTCKLWAASIWQEKNLYTPPEVLVPGTTVVVVIEDTSRMRYNLDVENSKTSTVSSSPDASITAFLPPVNSNSDITHTNEMKVENRGTIALRVGATVGARQNDGSYTIQGTKTYTFNGVATSISVNGQVHPQSVRGNSVYSDKVIGFRMAINTTTQGLGLNLTRQLGEEDTASTELTEQEKQQIITDYLQNMIDELSK